MTNPYKVLGVEENASDDEIKKAYKKLSRKYHPDANINNPNKAQAEEKFKEVQEAYDTIMKMKSGQYSGGYEGTDPFGDFGGFGGFGGYGQRRTDEQSQDEKYMSAAIDYIRAGYYEQALNVLLQVDKRNAGWYYLSAIANLSVGNNVIALQHSKQAVEMEPDNMEYRNLLYRIQQGAVRYTERSMPYGGMSFDGDPCTGFCVASALCNCCCPGIVC